MSDTHHSFPWNSGENKITINKKFKLLPEHPLQRLEPWVGDEDYVKRQVGFCAEWSLDNLCKPGVTT